MHSTLVVSSVNIFTVFCEVRPYFFLFCKVGTDGSKTQSHNNHSLQHSQPIFSGQTVTDTE